MDHIASGPHQRKEFLRLIQNTFPLEFYLSKLNVVSSSYSNVAIPLVCFADPQS